MCIFTRFVALWVSLSSFQLIAQEEKKEEEPKVDVFVEKVQPSSVYDGIRYGGFVRSGEVQELFTPVEGHLEKVFVALGQKVEKGAKLYTFNPSVAGQLYNKQVVTAPRSGTVSFIASHDTSRYKAGETLMTISDVKKKSVRIQVTYEDMLFLKTNPPVKLKAHAGTELQKKLEGEILAISPAADSVTSTFAVDVLLLDPESVVPIGSYVEAEFQKNIRQAIVVPITALNDKRTKVFIVKDKLIEPIDVELGKYFEDTVEIKSGLEINQTLVIKYAENPKKGDLANILKPKDRTEKIDAAANPPPKSRG